MAAVRLGHELEERLDQLSKKTGRTKSFYIKKALNKFLEDQEDYLLAVESLNDPRPSIPFDKLRKELGLAD